MTPAYKAYLKRVKQSLCCSRAERKRLLTGMEQEILETFPEPDSASMEQIEEQYGPPEEMAQELQQILPSGSIRDSAKKRLRRICLLFSLGLLAVALTAGGIIYRERAKAGNTPPEVVIITQPPEIIIVTPQPFSELPPVSIPPETQP